MDGMNTLRSLALVIIAATSINLVSKTFAVADVTAPSGRVIECFCTDKFGQRHEIGDIICLTVDNRSFMAKCVMAQTNPFWRDQKIGCPSSKAAATPMTPKPRVVAFLQ